MITVSFAYNNHRGVTEARTVDLLTLDFLTKPGFGYQPGWFLTGFCHDRKAIRSFALTHMVLMPESAAPLSLGLRIVIDRLGVERHNMPIYEQEIHDEDQRNSSDAVEGTRSEDGSGDD